MAIKKILKRKRKVETERSREGVESEEERGCIRSPWNHGAEWLRREMIGKGSFGSVFRATAKKPKLSDRFPDVLAVKSAECSRSASIEHEAEVLYCVQGSPFVIGFLGEEFTTADDGDDIYNLLLEFASGGTLGGLIRKSRGRGLPESLVRQHTRSILQGVKHIHQCNYVHCDLKPENILLVPCTSSHGVVAKVADLGLARRRKECAGGWRGTPMYTDPEAFINEAQDQYSDIWSVGCIVLEMLTGKVPWDSKPAGSSLEDFFDMVVSESAPKIPDQISDVARDFLKSCLATRCEERLTAEKLLLHPFVAQAAPQAPQALQAPDHKKVVVKRRRIARENRVFAVRTKPVCAVL